MAMSRGLVAFVLVGCEAVAQPPRVPARGQAVQAAPTKPLLVITETPHAAPLAAAPESLTPAQVAAAASASVVVIRTPTGMGAGFLVAPNLVATCLHVVAGAEQIVIQARDGVEHPATSVLAYSRANDIALLSVDALGAPSLTLGEFSDVRPGDAVTVIGHPEGLESTVSTGIVSAIREFNTVPILQLTAPISPGSSGGPVLDQHGRVVGVTRALLPDGQQLNFATPVSALQKLLARDHSPTPLAAFAEATAAREDTARPAAAPQSPQPAASSLPLLPANVGGFEFGMTVQQAKLACASPGNQAAARAGMTWYTELEVDGVFGNCPYAPQPLDFVSKVVLIFAADHVVRIGLVATTAKLARVRMGSKYGPPDSCEISGRLVACSQSVERRATELDWYLNGGLAFLKLDKPPMLVFVSDKEDTLKKQGF